MLTDVIVLLLVAMAVIGVIKSIRKQKKSGSWGLLRFLFRLQRMRQCPLRYSSESSQSLSGWECKEEET